MIHSTVSTVHCGLNLLLIVFACLSCQVLKSFIIVNRITNRLLTHQWFFPVCKYIDCVHAICVLYIQSIMSVHKMNTEHEQQNDRYRLRYDDLFHDSFSFSYTLMIVFFSSSTDHIMINNTHTVLIVTWSFQKSDSTEISSDSLTSDSKSCHARFIILCPLFCSTFALATCQRLAVSFQDRSWFCQIVS